MAAGVLVGVVANDRDVRDAAGDAAVDACDSAGELVEIPVEPVDASLQRDREVDEVGAAAAEQRLLRGPDPRAAGRRRRRRARAATTAMSAGGDRDRPCDGAASRPSSARPGRGRDTSRSCCRAVTSPGTFPMLHRDGHVRPERLRRQLEIRERDRRLRLRRDLGDRLRLSCRRSSPRPSPTSVTGICTSG